MPIKVYYSGACIGYNHTQPKPINQVKQKPVRTFKIKGKHKRQIVSSAFYGYEIKKYNFVFFTLTYQSTQYLDNPFDHNKHISYFFEYLTEKKTIGNGYLWTKELTKIGVPHYHCLVDLRFTSVKILNKYWCNARKQEFAGNALQTDKKYGFVIKSKFGAAAYAAKYATKGKDKGEKVEYKFNSRAFAISKGWTTKIITVGDTSTTERIHENVIPLSSCTQNEYFQTEFTEIFRVDQNFAKELINSGQY